MYRLLASLMLLLLGFGYALYSRSNTRKKKLERKMDRLEQRATQSMMHPHFVFNAMNSIQQLMNEANIDAANRYLSDFGKLIRLNMAMAAKDRVSLENELRFIELYISFEQLRFGNRLLFSIDINPLIDIEDVQMPANIIKPLVELLIWHSILPTEGDRRITISIGTLPNDILQINIKDNGKGLLSIYNPEKTNDVGDTIDAIRLRLHRAGKQAGQQVHIELSEAHHRQEFPGTIISLVVPQFGG